MELREEFGDLFSAEHGYTFMHCISGDFTLGAGIAAEFNKRYNMKERLHLIYGCSPAMEDTYNNRKRICTERVALPIDNVFNLVTKDFYYEKPTIDSLQEALEDAKEIIKDQCIKKIAIPRIGCGLDGLKWEDVKDVITYVFGNEDIEIVVYSKQTE